MLGKLTYLASAGGPGYAAQFRDAAVNSIENDPGKVAKMLELARHAGNRAQTELYDAHDGTVAILQAALDIGELTDNFLVQQLDIAVSTELEAGYSLPYRQGAQEYEEVFNDFMPPNAPGAYDEREKCRVMLGEGMLAAPLSPWLIGWYEQRMSVETDVQAKAIMANASMRR